MKQKWLQGVIFFLLFFIVIPANAVGKSQKVSQIDTTENLKFNFYVQGDSVSFWGDSQDQVQNQKNLRDGVNSPRARGGLAGKKWDWVYRLVYDTAEMRIKEAYVSYQQQQSLSITIGQEKTPYDFWFASSITRLNFLERALPVNALGPGFRTGLWVEYSTSAVTFSLGLVGPEVNNTILGNNLKGHMPLASNWRVTFSPIHSNNEVLHFAYAGIFQDSDSLGRFRFRTFPEVQSSHNYSLVDTGFIYHCKNFLGREGEVALILNSLSLTGAYYHTLVNRNPDNLNFEGAYVTADYFLSGEHYIYNSKRGGIMDVSQIKHWYGAWQLAVRCSCLDLNSNATKGGREQNLTVGINWFANKNARFTLNYIYANTTPSDNGLNRHVNILGLRCQISGEML